MCRSSSRMSWSSFAKSSTPCAASLFWGSFFSYIVIGGNLLAFFFHTLLGPTMMLRNSSLHRSAPCTMLPHNAAVHRSLASPYVAQLLMLSFFLRALVSSRWCVLHKHGSKSNEWISNLGWLALFFFFSPLFFRVHHLNLHSNLIRRMWTRCSSILRERRKKKLKFV